MPMYKVCYLYKHGEKDPKDQAMQQTFCCSKILKQGALGRALVNFILEFKELIYMMNRITTQGLITTG